MFAPTEAWVCPVCKAGVAPGVSRCDHGGKVDAVSDLFLTVPTDNPPPGSPWRAPGTSDWVWRDWGGGGIDSQGNWYSWWYDNNGVRHDSSGTRGN